MLNSRLLSAWQAKYHSLARREQSAVIIALTAVLAYLLVQFVYFPMNHRLNRLELSVQSKENDLSELKTIVAQFKRFEVNKENKGKTGEEPFNLFSVLEKLATKSGLMDKIDYMKPRIIQLDGLRNEKWVEVKLSQITMKELTGYLYNLQSFGRGVYIKRLSARKDGDYLNLVLQPAVVEKAKNIR